MEVKPGFKKTELGVIPIEWKTYLLEEISDRISVGLATSVTKHYRSSGVPIVRNLNIKDGFFDGSDMLFITPEFANANANKAARALDVLTVRTGSNLGQTCVLPLDFDNCQTFTTLITTPKKTIADPYFLCLHMSSEFGRNEMARLQAGGGKGNLNTGELKKYRVGLPNGLPEQRAIAEALSDVDGLLGGLDRLIAKKRDLKQAAMQQLLTGQTRLPGFHGEWEMKRLGDVVQIKKGQLITSSTLKPGNIPVIAGGKQPAYFHASANRYGRTVTISASGANAGYVALYDEPIFASDCSTISESENYCLDFVFYQLLCEQQTIYKAQTGGAQPHIHAKDLNPVLFSFPSLPEQTAIAEVLTEMDAELAALEQRREKTRALKQAMMQELLTGRTRLVRPQKVST